MNRLYRVVKIEGKNLGCVALKDIPKGTLILQERPQCIANWSDPEYTYLGVCSLISEYQLLISKHTFALCAFRKSGGMEVLENSNVVFHADQFSYFTISRKMPSFQIFQGFFGLTS